MAGMLVLLYIGKLSYDEDFVTIICFLFPSFGSPGLKYVAFSLYGPL